SAIVILMLQNVARRFLESLAIARTQQGVQKDVIRFQRGIGFQFAAPVALFTLIRKQELARTINGGGDSAGQVINFAETQLRYRRRVRRRGGGVVHNWRLLRAYPRWSAGNGLHNLGRQAETDILRHDFDFPYIFKT